MLNPIPCKDDIVSWVKPVTQLNLCAFQLDAVKSEPISSDKYISSFLSYMYQAVWKLFVFQLNKKNDSDMYNRKVGNK